MLSNINRTAQGHRNDHFDYYDHLLILGMISLNEQFDHYNNLIISNTQYQMIFMKFDQSDNDQI